MKNYFFFSESKLRFFSESSHVSAWSCSKPIALYTSRRFFMVFEATCSKAISICARPLIVGEIGWVEWGGSACKCLIEFPTKAWWSHFMYRQKKMMMKKSVTNFVSKIAAATKRIIEPRTYQPTNTTISEKYYFRVTLCIDPRRNNIDFSSRLRHFILFAIITIQRVSYLC